MGVFDGLSFDVLGLSAPLDFFVGVRLLYSDATWELYDNFHVDGDVALQFGATVNKTTGEYVFCVYCNYGHRGSNKATPARRDISANLGWSSEEEGAPPPGTAAGFTIDQDPGSGDWTVFSGQTIPPLIIHWDGNTGSVIGAPFEGYLIAFVETEMWKHYPQEGGEGERFAFRFDPEQEGPYGGVGYFRMMRGSQYGGAWLNDDAVGTYVRPDLLHFHLADGSCWYKHGDGFWLQKNQPTTTAGWRYLAARTHCTAGYLPFCSAYVKGGVAVHTNPAYHFAIKKFVAQYLAHFPPPFESWPNGFDNDYYNDANRARGRVIGLGVWIWRALVIVEQYRPNDAEVATLRLALQQRVLDIFALIYSYAKPFKLLPADPEPIWGMWTTNSVHGSVPHPDAGYGGIPSTGKLYDEALWMAGEFWKGLCHLWEGLRELGLQSAVQFHQCRQLMDFVAIGYAGAPNVVDQAGLFGMIAKWKGGTNSDHPYPSQYPDFPYKPPWANAPSWPKPGFEPVGGYGWALEYAHIFWNWNNDDMQYLSKPSTNTTGNRIAVFDFIKHESMLSDPADLVKINEIVSDYSGKSYHYHYAAPLVLVIGEVSQTTESFESDLAGVTPLELEIDEASDVSEVPVLDKSENILILQIDEASDVSEGLDLDAPALLVINEPSETVETIAFEGEEHPLLIQIDEAIEIGARQGGREVSLWKTASATARRLPPLLGRGVSILPPLLGGVPMRKNQDFKLYRGDDVLQPIVVTLDEGRNLDGSETWRAQIRDGRASAEAMAEFDSAEGTIDVDPVTHYPSLVVSPTTLPVSVFEPRDAPRKLPWDCEMTKDGKVETTSEGSVTIETDVTR